MNINDAHSHFMPKEIAEKTMFFKVGWSDIDRQLKTMDEQGIAQSLLLYPTSDAHLQMGGWEIVSKVYNEKIAAVVKQYPDRFVGGGILPVDQPSLIVPELKRMIDLNLKVISLASSYDEKYLDEEVFYPVYEFAAKHEMSIHVHPQIMNPIGEDRVKDPLLTPVLQYVFDVSISIGKLMMSGTFLKFPDVKFIFAHYGGVLPLVKERFDNTYQMLRKRDFVKDIQKNPSEYFKNLYFDTSGSRSIASLLCALEIVDESHVLFGSDFPANQNLKASVEGMATAPLTSGQKDAIFYKNFRNCFN